MPICVNMFTKLITFEFINGHTVIGLPLFVSPHFLQAREAQRTATFVPSRLWMRSSDHVWLCRQDHMYKMVRLCSYMNMNHTCMCNILLYMYMHTCITTTISHGAKINFSNYSLIFVSLLFLLTSSRSSIVFFLGGGGGGGSKNVKLLPLLIIVTGIS